MSELRTLTGWGGTAPTVAATMRATGSEVVAAVRHAGPRGLVARGLGRSYGDPAQNAGGTVLLPVPGPIEVDPSTGVVRTSAGTSLHDLMVELVPRGLFLPVTPGTRYVTVGGAIACDVHGKSHHAAGCFGEHVEQLTLLRTDGTEIVCGPGREPEWFAATVGGLGLTGLIVAARLR